MPATLAQISPYEAAGLLGVCLYVTAYALLQFRALRYGAVCFTVMNLCAAGLVGVSLVEDFNLASALIQGMWILMSLVGLARALLWPPRDAVDLVRPGGAAGPRASQEPSRSSRKPVKASQELWSARSW